MVAMLIGCGLRRAELLALRLESIQQREEHWVIADLVGKGGHMRTVRIPTWVKSTVDAWTAAAAVTHGPVFRAINKAGRVWGDGMSPKVLWDVVRAAAARALQLIAVLEASDTTARILRYLHLPTEVPPAATPRPPPGVDDWTRDLLGSLSTGCPPWPARPTCARPAPGDEGALRGPRTGVPDRVNLRCPRGENTRAGDWEGDTDVA